MTERLYLQDAYCFQHDAVITAVAPDALTLDRSCMYPGGGGQPPDTGTLIMPAGSSLPITTVRRDEAGELWHVFQVEPGGDALRDKMQVGTPCSLHLNAGRRLTLMRFHTALHVFNTVMLRGFDGWITGVRMDPVRSHIDFRVNYTPEMVRRIEAAVNDVLARQLGVGSYTISAEEFQQRPDLLRTLEAQPPIEDGRVRVVEIAGFEAQACGGTHVRDTGDVGRIRIVKVDNKGKQNRRFYIELVE